jgi:hypothetical protein
VCSSRWGRRLVRVRLGRQPRDGRGDHYSGLIKRTAGLRAIACCSRAVLVRVKKRVHCQRPSV